VYSAFVSILTVCRFVWPLSCSKPRSSIGATYSRPKALESMIAVPGVFQILSCRPHGAGAAWPGANTYIASEPLVFNRSSASAPAGSIANVSGA